MLWSCYIHALDLMNGSKVTIQPKSWLRPKKTALLAIHNIISFYYFAHHFRGGGGALLQGGVSAGGGCLVPGGSALGGGLCSANDVWWGGLVPGGVSAPGCCLLPGVCSQVRLVPGGFLLWGVSGGGLVPMSWSQGIVMLPGGMPPVQNRSTRTVIISFYLLHCKTSVLAKHR